MKLQKFCSACMIQQALYAMKANGIDPETRIDIVEKLLSEIPAALDQPTPSHFQSILLNSLTSHLDIVDLYHAEKTSQNQAALQYIPFVLEKILTSPDPLYSSALFSVEGNNFDPITTKAYDIQAVIKEVLNHRFVIDDYKTFETKFQAAQSIVFVCDNAGEIAFDRIFMEQCQAWKTAHHLPKARFSIVVKSGPVLNDATLEDAVLMGLPSVGMVYESGSNALGLPLERVGEELKSVIAESDLIISKGQANFETLGEEEGIKERVFFFLKAKCLHVAGELKVPAGSSVLYHPQ